jgi:hypothetical protein
LPNIPDAIVAQMNDIARGEMKCSNILPFDDNASTATSAPSHDPIEEIPTIHDEADRVAAADDLPFIDSATAEADTADHTPDSVTEPDQQASSPVDVPPSSDDSSPSSEPTPASPESSEPAPRSDRHGYRRFLYAFSARARTALQSYSESVREAIRLEIEQLHQKGVFEPTSVVRPGHRVIPCSYFVKEKYNGDGKLMKLKGMHQRTLFGYPQKMELDIGGYHY